ncbi:TPA: IstB-like ATP-binding domain-containing protein, partial [Enterococcus faecium]|nr:IstB-like ATP-binding domain-containing protein [Enterococcus faecium]
MMLNEQTEVKLAELKLSGMLESYREQMTNKEYQSMSFEDRFNLMVDLEHSRRKNNKLQ